MFYLHSLSCLHKNHIVTKACKHSASYFVQMFRLVWIFWAREENIFICDLILLWIFSFFCIKASNIRKLNESNLKFENPLLLCWCCADRLSNFLLTFALITFIRKLRRASGEHQVWVNEEVISNQLWHINVPSPPLSPLQSASSLESIRLPSTD